MKKKSLDHHLVSYYNAKKLAPERRRELLSLIDGDKPVDTDSKKRPSQFTLFLQMLGKPGNFAYATIIIALGYIVYHVSGITNDSDLMVDLTTAISREIAMNHTAQFNVEFNEQNIAELAVQMDKLDFNLLMPKKLPQSLTIKGARYCSIRGKIAAQIQMTDNEGNFYTLYQTRLVQPLTEIDETETHLGDYRYMLWHENGVFLGFAGPAERN